VKRPQDPQSQAQWREAATLARAYLLIDAAKTYGLMVGGPAIDVDRCERVLEQARARGVEVPDEHAEAAALELIAQHNAQAAGGG